MLELWSLTQGDWRILPFFKHGSLVCQPDSMPSAGHHVQVLPRVLNEVQIASWGFIFVLGVTEVQLPRGTFVRVQIPSRIFPASITRPLFHTHSPS